MEVEASFNL